MTTPAPRPVSTTAPAWMTWIGIVLLLGSVGIAIFTVGLFISVLPTGILNRDGSPGEDVVASIDAGSSASVELDDDTDYMVVLVRPNDAPEAALSGEITVTAPDGTSEAASRTPAVDTNASGEGFAAESYVAFTTGAEGSYEIDVPAASDDETTSALIVEEGSVPGMVGGILGSIGGVFAAILSGLIGLGLTIGGGLWWRSRLKARRAASPTPAR